MILEILRRTPPWVFVLFALLVYVGYVQSRTRTMSLTRVAILPLALLALSAFGVLSAVGQSAFGLGCWLFAIALAVAANVVWKLPRGVNYSPETKTFTVPGSWWPLAVIMVIFFARYAVNVAPAMDHSLRQTPAFIAGVGFIYRLSSGFFLARALAVRKAARR